MGSGRASGQDRAIQAATAAISSPLLNDVSIDGAQALLVNITGGESMTLHEVADATSVIVNAAGEQANVIFGTVVDPSIGDEVCVTLIATGFGEPKKSVLPLREETGGTRQAPPVSMSIDADESDAHFSEVAVGAEEAMSVDAVAEDSVTQQTSSVEADRVADAPVASAGESAPANESGSLRRSLRGFGRGRDRGADLGGAAGSSSRGDEPADADPPKKSEWSISRDRPVFIKRLVD